MPERNYTHSEMRTMQDEAIQRVMEMQRIANERLRLSNLAAEGGHEHQQEQVHQETRPSGQQHRGQNQAQQSQPRNRQPEGEHARRQESRGHPSPSHHAMPVDLPEPQQQEHQQPSSSPLSFLTSGAFEGIVKRLGLETDQLILMGLLLLLINEGADTVLIMAVFYLLI